MLSCVGCATVGQHRKGSLLLTPRIAELILSEYPHRADLLILRDAIDTRLRQDYDTVTLTYQFRRPRSLFILAEAGL